MKCQNYSRNFNYGKRFNITTLCPVLVRWLMGHVLLGIVHGTQLKP